MCDYAGCVLFWRIPSHLMLGSSYPAYDPTYGIIGRRAHPYASWNQSYLIYEKARKRLLRLCPPTLGSILRLNGLAPLLRKLYPLDLRAAMLRGRKHTKEARHPSLSSRRLILWLRIALLEGQGKIWKGRKPDFTVNSIGEELLFYFLTESSDEWDGAATLQLELMYWSRGGSSDSSWSRTSN